MVLELGLEGNSPRSCYRLPFIKSCANDRLARLASKAASGATGRSNRENGSARNQMQRRCADRPVSPFRRVEQFRYHPGGLMGKREPQTILKTDERLPVGQQVDGLTRPVNPATFMLGDFCRD